MCQQIAEGVHYRGCSHFVVNFFPVSIKDCNQSNCTKSCRHPANCYNPNCTREWGPVIDKCSAMSYEKCPNCTAAIMAYQQQQQQRAR
ncbi:hypothetical protein M407DRAFT_242107 [Tulasnella calospora MUT 4182]|uniref:Uncharacterized protein n=1 Tax=Tulasnella calospora MUT 4182 TaxID=1051891 RepID=A0A0C3MAP3_9AGAM|nr:hypothetical protein M407DRAFT_242107 [Tulasnella calospora MUT 4182]